MHWKHASAAETSELPSSHSLLDNINNYQYLEMGFPNKPSAHLLGANGQFPHIFTLGFRRGVSIPSYHIMSYPTNS